MFDRFINFIRNVPNFNSIIFDEVKFYLVGSIKPVFRNTHQYPASGCDIMNPTLYCTGEKSVTYDYFGEYVNYLKKCLLGRLCIFNKKQQYLIIVRIAR